MSTLYRVEKPSFAERFGIIFGGSALVAIFGLQIAFVAWLAGW